MLITIFDGVYVLLGEGTVMDEKDTRYCNMSGVNFGLITMRMF